MTVAPGSALAVSAAKQAEMKDTGACLLQNCGKELAKCVTDEKCLEDLVCLQGCFGQPDEGDCQIRCGDLYASQGGRDVQHVRGDGEVVRGAAKGRRERIRCRRSTRSRMDSRSTPW